MSKRVPTSFLAVFLFLTPTVFGAEVTGSVLYDDRPVSSVFTDFTWMSVTAYSGSGGSYPGTFDAATSTYRFEGLDVDSYQIYIHLDRVGPGNEFGNPGDLDGTTNLEISDPGDSIELDLDIRYTYGVVSPIDAALPLEGMGQDCEAHPAVTYPITFAVDPVPLAVSYRFSATQMTCPRATAGFIHIDSGNPFAEIQWGSAGEDFHQLSVACTGASGKELCIGPLYRYTDGEIWRLMLTNDDSTSRGVHRSDAVVLPAVAGTPGAQGTYWTSAVSVVNLGSTDKEIEVLYTPRGENGLTTYTSQTVLLHAGSQLSWTDILAELFGTTGAGALEIRGHQLAVSSRTSTPATAAGSYGQGIPPIQPEQVLRTGGAISATMGGVEENATFRTNLGLCEVWGENLTVRVTISGADMIELGHRDYTLRPYENIQVNKVASTVAGVSSLTNGTATVEVISGNGRVGAYLSVVDNSTGDPTFIAVAEQSPAGG